MALLTQQFEKTSRLFFQRVQEGRFALVLSGLVEQEISRSPLEVQELLTRFAFAALLTVLSVSATAQTITAALTP